MAPTMAAAAARATGSVRSRDGIITCLFYGQNRRPGAIARGCARRPGTLPRRIPGFLVSLAARDRGSPRHLDGDPAQAATRALCPLRDARIDRRVSVDVCPRTKRRRRARPQALPLVER